MPDDNKKLLDAIAHCKDVAERSSESYCADQHKQLGTWLEELLDRRRQHPDPKDVVAPAQCARGWCDVAKSQFITAVVVKIAKDYDRLWDAVRDFEFDEGPLEMYGRLKLVYRILGVEPLPPTVDGDGHPTDINEARRARPAKD